MEHRLAYRAITTWRRLNHRRAIKEPRPRHGMENGLAKAEGVTPVMHGCLGSLHGVVESLISFLGFGQSCDCWRRRWVLRHLLCFVFHGLVGLEDLDGIVK